MSRTLLDGSTVNESPAAVELTIRTKCPEKWLLVDRETGEIYTPYATPGPKQWKHIIGVANAWSDAHPGYIDGFEEVHKNNNYKLQLTSLWVNKQKKYEFNPLHTHPSVLSFVIWVKIPYRLEDEINYFPQITGTDLGSGNVHTSKFFFVYVDTLGSIKQLPIPVDSSYEGTIMMFPSALNHGVYPFYTSDEYRISVSGNIRINVLDHRKEN